MEPLDKQFKKLSVKQKDLEEKKVDKTDKIDKKDTNKVPLNTEKTLMTEGSQQENSVNLV